MTYTDNGLVSDGLTTPYYYVVKAEFADGSESNESPEASGIPVAFP